MRKYDPWIKRIVQSPGNMSHVICTTLGSMEKYGIGMIVPSNIYRFYDDLHSYLASCNVDGVKEDVQMCRMYWNFLVLVMEAVSN